MSKIAIIILNWNGISYLKQFLPSVVEYSSNAQIIVADNCSSDDSISFIEQNYPNIEIIKNHKNYGFARGYNEALKQVRSKYYVLLNSDVEVTKNWLEPMLTELEKNDKIAACQPKIKNYKKKEYFEYAGASGGFIDKLGYPFCRGRIFNTIEKDNGQYDNAIEIFWASGACLFIRSEVYHQIGGLDEFFFAHMEEIDLCWRIKNLGYKIMVYPSSIVFHVGGGTLDKSKPQKTFLNFRNSLLMLHKNLPQNKVFLIILQRLFLDSLAGIKFLLEKKPKHSFAIIKAHFSFYRAMKQNKLKKDLTRNYHLIGMINKNILLNYFFKKIKTYSNLIK